MFNEVATRLLDQIARELSSPDVVFPTSFELTIRVQALLKDPNVSIDRLTDFIRTEPLMSSRIIAYANSAALRGAAGEILDLHAAILRIGLDAVRSVSYTMAVEQIIRSKHMMPFQDLSNRIWDHSLAVAATARILAKQFRKDREKAFFLGMVHDIGAFYLMFRCSTDEVLSAHRDMMLELVFDWHDGIGHALLSAMNQPEDILAAVQDHEAAATITHCNSWSTLLSAADVLGQQISDWALPELRARNPRTISDSLMSQADRAALKEQAKEELSSLRAALF